MATASDSAVDTQAIRQESRRGSQQESRRDSQQGSSRGIRRDSRRENRQSTHEEKLSVQFNAPTMTEAHERPPVEFRAPAMTEKQVADLKEAFTLFDTDGDGKITTAKLGHVMHSLGSNPSDEELEAMIQSVDRKGKGTVSFEQFLHVMSRKMTDSNCEEVIREAFKLFDTEGRGVINADGLCFAMRYLGQELAETEAKDMLEQVDTDHDGTVTYEDFLTFATDLLIKHNRIPGPM